MLNEANQHLINDIAVAVKNGNRKQAAALITEAINAKIPADVIDEKGLLTGYRQVIDLFRAGDAYIPEFLTAKRACEVSRTLLFGPNREAFGASVVMGIPGCSDLGYCGNSYSLTEELLYGARRGVINLDDCNDPNEYVNVVNNYHIKRAFLVKTIFCEVGSAYADDSFGDIVQSLLSNTCLTKDDILVIDCHDTDHMLSYHVLPMRLIDEIITTVD